MGLQVRRRIGVGLDDAGGCFVYGLGSPQVVVACVHNQAATHGGGRAAATAAAATHCTWGRATVASGRASPGPSASTAAAAARASLVLTGVVQPLWGGKEEEGL